MKRALFCKIYYFNARLDVLLLNLLIGVVRWIGSNGDSFQILHLVIREQ